MHIDEWMHEGAEWMNEQINEKMDGWMNKKQMMGELINEWIDE